MKARKKPRKLNKLETLRIKSGYKCQFIADKLGVSRATLRNYETGKSKIGTLEGEKLAELYGVSVDTIEKYAIR